MKRLLTALMSVFLAVNAVNAQSISRGITTWHADENFNVDLDASFGSCPPGQFVSGTSFGTAPSCGVALSASPASLTQNLLTSGYAINGNTSAGGDQINNMSVNGVLNATAFGAVCSDTTETATTTASNAVVTVGAIGDFKVGQYVKLDAAGATNTVATPTISSVVNDGYFWDGGAPGLVGNFPVFGAAVTANGYCKVDAGTAANSNTSCSTTYGYSVQNVGQTGIGTGLNGMRSAASSTSYITTGPAGLSIGNAVLISYSVDANTAGTIIRRCTGASCTPSSIYAVIPNPPGLGSTSAQYRDNGKPYGIDEEASTSAVAADLNAQITNVSGTSVTLSVAPSQSVSKTMRHDNAPALQQAVNASVLAGAIGSKVYLPACATHYNMAQAVSFWQLSQAGIKGPGTNSQGGISANIRWDGPPGGVVFNMNLASADSLEGIGLDGLTGNTPGIMIDMDRYPASGWSQSNAGPGAPNSGVTFAGLPPTALNVRSVNCGVVGLCLNLGGAENDENAVVDGLACSTPNGVGGNICVYSDSQETYNEAFYNTGCSYRDYCFDFPRIGSFVMLNTNVSNVGVAYFLDTISNYGRIEGGVDEGAQVFLYGNGGLGSSVAFSDWRIGGGSGPWATIVKAVPSYLFENFSTDSQPSPVTSMNFVGGGTFINDYFGQPQSYLGITGEMGGGTSPMTSDGQAIPAPYFIPMGALGYHAPSAFTCIHCSVYAQTVPAIVSDEPNQSTAFNSAPAATALTGTAGTATCSMSMQGTLKTATCYLNAYDETGTAQTFTFPTAFSTAPNLLASCGTYEPSSTATVLTLPANAGMSAETCNITAIGQ